MNKIMTAMATMALFAPATAMAEDGDRNPLTGPKVGVEITHDWNRIRQLGGTLDAKRNGIGVRGFAGYDIAIADSVIVGGEIGIGKGGRTSDQASLVTGGRYRVDPGLTYDITGRVGFMPVENLMVYGRGGYRWLETKQVIVDQPTGNGTTKVTQKGFTYGAGLEYALTPNISVRAEYNRTNFDRNFKQDKASVGATYRF